MKKKIFLTGIVGFILLFTILYTACSNGAGGTPEIPITIDINGTWIRESDDVELRISGSNWEAWAGGIKQYGGTFTYTDTYLYLTVTYPPAKTGESVHNYSLSPSGNLLEIFGGSNPDLNGIYYKEAIKPDMAEYDHVWEKNGYQLWMRGSIWEWYNEWNSEFTLICSGTFTDDGSTLYLTTLFPPGNAGRVSKHDYTKTGDSPGDTVIIHFDPYFGDGSGPVIDGEYIIVK